MTSFRSRTTYRNQEDVMEQLPRVYLSRDEMMKRIARFKDLKGFDDISDRTVDRWVNTGILPPPAMRIKGVRYWDEAELEAADRARMAQSHKNQQTNTEPQDAA